jgi:hypothetical protein
MAIDLAPDRAAYRRGSPGVALGTRIGRWAGYLAILLVAATLLAIWLVSGVPIGDISRFIAFEALYVLFPGCLLYVLLNPVPAGRLTALAIGWPLGYALEIGAFALTAGLHVRWAFAFLPLICAVTIGPGILFKRRRARCGLPDWGAVLRGGLPGGRDWGVESLVGASAITIALALLAFRYFAIYPLPEHAGSAFYFVDNVWDVSLAAEALHHWPIVEPYLAGHPLRYYTGVFIHVAAVKQVTGVPLAAAILRLLPATSTVVAMLQFWCLGGLLVGSRRAEWVRWGGPLTVMLLVVIENMKLYPTHTKVFGVALFSEFTWSPTYGFGVIFLLGLLILFRARLLGMSGADRAHPLTAGAPARSTAGTPSGVTPAGAMSGGVMGPLVMLGILVLGGSAVKTTATATFVVGLGLFWLWRRLAGEQASRLLSYCVVVSFACFAAMYLLLLYGAGGPAATELELAPLEFLKYTVFGATLAAHPGLVPLLGVVVVIFLWKLLPVAGILWPLRRWDAWSPYVSLALAVFVAGFLSYVMLGSVDDNETYFVWYGYIALIPVGTLSLMVVWSEVPGDARIALARMCAAVLLLGLAVAGATQILIANGTLAGVRSTSRYLWYGVTLTLVGGIVVLGSLRLEGRLASIVSSRGARVAACAILLLGVLGCAESLVLAAPQTWNTLLDRQAVKRNSPSHPGITAALYRGLVWVREHSGSCAILAANTHELRAAGTTSGRVDSGYFDYSAFAEREFFFESWIMAGEADGREQPYPALYALNYDATLRGSPTAIRQLAQRGVSYILIDKSHGAYVREPESVSRLVFSNSALDVYRLTVPVRPVPGC